MGRFPEPRSSRLGEVNSGNYYTRIVTRAIQSANICNWRRSASCTRRPKLGSELFHPKVLFRVDRRAKKEEGDAGESPVLLQRIFSGVSKRSDIKMEYYKRESYIFLWGYADSRKLDMEHSIRVLGNDGEEGKKKRYR